MARKLGENQRHVLRSMLRGSGVWYHGCGWIWDNYSGTVRIMESLERRGLVRRANPESTRFIVNKEAAEAALEEV